MVNNTEMHFIKSQGIIDHNKCCLFMYDYRVNNDKIENGGLVNLQHLINDQRDASTKVACSCFTDGGY